MRNSVYQTMFTAQAANGTSNPMLVSDFRHIIVDIATALLGIGGTLTITFKGSIGLTPPTFSSAASDSNRWSYVEIIDTKTGKTMDGDVGVTIATTDDLKKVEINTNGLDWVAATVSGYSAPGNVTIFAKCFSES